MAGKGLFSRNFLRFLVFQVITGFLRFTVHRVKNVFLDAKKQ